MDLGTLSLNPIPQQPPPLEMQQSDIATTATSSFAAPATAASSSASGSSSASTSHLMKKVAVHLEARLFQDSVAAPEAVKQAILGFVQAHVKVYRVGAIEGYAHLDPGFLGQHVESLGVTELGTCGTETAVSSWRAVPLVHVYQLYDSQHLGGTDFALPTDGQAGSGDGATAFTAYLCPCKKLSGLWESIHVAASTKQQLLSLAETAMVFATAGVDSTLVSGNRLILLYGEPGTGKTTLAKGLAQKLSIRHGEAFSGVELLNVNSHALCSKFFGESSSLVGKVFGAIRDKVGEDSTTLFLLAIDEVETICGSRAQALAKGSNEPSDAVRIVNSVLTQLDSLRAFPNVLTIATSNVTDALDEAFLDRCDLKLYVGLPGAEGRYVILRSTLLELMRCEVVAPRVSLPERLDLLPSVGGAAATAANGHGVGATSSSGTNGTVGALPPAAPVGQLLLRLVTVTDGTSGRALRKLPLLAHSLLSAPRHVTLGEFLVAMEEAVQQSKIVASSWTV